MIKTWRKGENVDGQISIFDYLWKEEDTERGRKAFEDKCILDAMKRGSNFSDGKKRIAELYQSGVSQPDRVDAIKKEYGIGGWGSPICGDGLKGADYSANGIRVDYMYHGDGYAVMLGWKHVEEYIHRLVDCGEYYTGKIIAYCHATLDPCNRENLTDIAHDLGMKCEAKCCAGCPEKKECGAACNQSHKY